MNIRVFSLCTFFMLLGFQVIAQDDLLSELDSTVQTKTEPVTAAFKALQIVTLQSTKLPAKNEFYFVVSHRFGTVKNGFSEFFGLDNATTKIGGIYGITEGLAVSLSRHTFLKTYEGAVKYKLVSQTDEFPVSLVGYHVVDINSAIKKDDYKDLSFSDRMAFVNQLLISRKFSSKLSLELIPSYIHRNLYEPTIENDDQFTLAAGGRYKLSKRLSLNVEYGHNFNKPDYYSQPLSVGLDVETGGHVFQLIFTNSQAMTESSYLTNAAGDWGKGDFFFGFNLYRVF